MGLRSVAADSPVPAKPLLLYYAMLSLCSGLVFFAETRRKDGRLSKTRARVGER